jgi:hypothetical protein
MQVYEAPMTRWIVQSNKRTSPFPYSPHKPVFHSIETVQNHSTQRNASSSSCMSHPPICKTRISGSIECMDRTGLNEIIDSKHEQPSIDVTFSKYPCFTTAPLGELNVPASQEEEKRMNKKKKTEVCLKKALSI